MLIHDWTPSAVFFTFVSSSVSRFLFPSVVIMMPQQLSVFLTLLHQLGVTALGTDATNANLRGCFLDQRGSRNGFVHWRRVAIKVCACVQGSLSPFHWGMSRARIMCHVSRATTRDSLIWLNVEADRFCISINRLAPIKVHLSSAHFIHTHSGALNCLVPQTAL
jgi:hypothetical protein